MPSNRINSVKTYSSLTATCHIRDIDTQGVEYLCLPKTTQIQPKNWRPQSPSRFILGNGQRGCKVCSLRCLEEAAQLLSERCSPPLSVQAELWPLPAILEPPSSFAIVVKYNSCFDIFKLRAMVKNGERANPYPMKN